MKKIIFTLLIGFTSLLVTGQAQDKKAITPPERALTELEKKFIGKWIGSRSVYKWEIERKKDRTFEIAFTEPDEDNPKITYKNYATGVWWIEGKVYKYAWIKWWGDKGDFEGLQTEIIDSVKKLKITTLTKDDFDPNNIEIRVKDFKMKVWSLKPKKI